MTNLPRALSAESRPTTPSSRTAAGIPGLTAGDAERVAAALEAELAGSTLEVYASAWRRWDVWCGTGGIRALPASPETVAAYLAERAEAGLSYGSIDLACSAIAHRHRQHGAADPTTDLTVRRVRRGLRFAGAGTLTAAGPGREFAWLPDRRRYCAILVSNRRHWEA